jgi:hypothetical protein
VATYASLQDIRDRGVDQADADDAAVERALARATLVIDAYCGRDFWKRDETYLVDGTGKDAIFLDDRPVVQVTELKADEQIISPDSYLVYSQAGYIRLNGGISLFGSYPGVFPKGAQNIEVHGFFGYENVPPEIGEACILLSLMFLRSAQAEANIAESQANTTDKAVGIRRVKIDELSVEFEYPKDVAVGTSRRRTTGLVEADRLLARFRHDLEAMAI